MHLVKSILFLVGVLAMAMGKPAAHGINDICDKITDYFNIIAGLGTIYANIQEGIDQEGEPQSLALMEIEPAAQRLKDCTVIPVGSKLVVEISLTDRIRLNLTEYNVSISDCEVKLHFIMKPGIAKGIEVKLSLAEVSSLGKVELDDGTDFTVEAEALIRPLLFRAFKNFTTDYFSMTFDEGFNRSSDALFALQFLFKESVLQILKRTQ